LIKQTLGLSLALVLGLGVSGWAQSAGGNIYGTVTDESGAALGGVSATLKDPSTNATRTTTAGSQGEFRFLGMTPGTYKLTVSLTGFSTVSRDLIVTTGVNANVTFNLKVASMQESVTVEAETPTVDTKRVGTSTTMDKDELTKTPQGRDPWAVLKTVPGVLVDRVSIAGNEAGQQSLFVGKGAQMTDSMWNMDGVQITDTTSYGGSSEYFDFEAFDEINVTTGGGDLKVQTGGIGINFVTKRGTNEFHGAAHSYFSNHKAGESTNVPSELSGNPNLIDGRADQIRQIHDYGVDIGGPILKDKLWFWGSYGKNDIRVYRFYNGKEDDTVLPTWNAKLNWQAGSQDMLSFLWFSNAKEKFGRDPGYEANNQALWNQGNFYPTTNCKLPCGMHGLWKLEWNHTFNSNLFVNTKYAYFNWGYGFDPQSQNPNGLSINHVTGSATGSAYATRYLKPWHIANLDGSYFATGGGGQHEVKFGFGYRYMPNVSSLAWAGNGIVAVTNSATDPTANVAWVTRPDSVNFTAKYASAYLGDTFTKGRATINAGVRYDHQEARVDPTSIQGNPLFPSLVPPITYDGSGPGITWNDFSPRVGVSVALNESRKTVARASYARYAGQLAPPDAQFNSPVAYGYTYLAYHWVDLNGDGFAQPNEILTNQGVVYASNIDPAHPGATTSLNRIDPNYHANHDSEVIVGLDHELMPNFSLGAAYTWRRGTGIVSYTPRVDASGNILPSTDYVALAPVSAGGFTVQPYAPNSIAASSNRMLTNRPDTYFQYNGVELSAYKRLSKKWMMRTALAWMSWTEDFTGAAAIQNPSSTDLNGQIGGVGILYGPNASGYCGPCVNGGPVLLKSYSSKKNTYASANWQVSSNALYQLPADFELGASFIARQGYPRTFVIRTGMGADGNVPSSGGLIPAGGADIQRFDNVYNLDLRLGRGIKLGGSASAHLTVDLFNVFNSSTVLQRARNLAIASGGNVTEITNPRILRFGVQLQF
jgi:hypothetical protein